MSAIVFFSPLLPIPDAETRADLTDARSVGLALDAVVDLLRLVPVRKS